jgi:hypothetical protein
MNDKGFHFSTQEICLCRKRFSVIRHFQPCGVHRASERPGDAFERDNDRRRHVVVESRRRDEAEASTLLTCHAVAAGMTWLPPPGSARDAGGHNTLLRKSGASPLSSSPIWWDSPPSRKAGIPKR